MFFPHRLNLCWTLDFWYVSHSHGFKMLILLYTTTYNPQIISSYFFQKCCLWLCSCDIFYYIHNLITCHYYKWLLYHCPLPWALLAFCVRGIILTSLSCPITLFNAMWEEITYVSFEPKFWVIELFQPPLLLFPSAKRMAGPS